MNIWTNRQTDSKIEFTCIWGSLRLAPNTSDETSYKIYYYKGIVPQTNILCQYLKQGHNLNNKGFKETLNRSCTVVSAIRGVPKILRFLNPPCKSLFCQDFQLTFS